MAVDLPTVDQFLERFPSFEGQDDMIEQLLTEITTLKLVDERWRTSDQRIAAQYLLAHMLTTETDAGSAPISAESLGPISVSYFISDKMMGLASTEYGRRFLLLRDANFGGGAAILVVGGGRC